MVGRVTGESVHGDCGSIAAAFHVRDRKGRAAAHSWLSTLQVEETMAE